MWYREHVFRREHHDSDPGEPNFEFHVEGDLEDDDEKGRGRIRCPKCKWQPRKHDTWECACGHVWNTFDTRGVCPGCSEKWHHTQCPVCMQWSAHEDWYVRDGGPRL